MAKKIVLGLLVLAAVSSFVGAQETKVAISLDAFPLVKGFLWTDKDLDQSLSGIVPNIEFRCNDKFTLSIGMDIYNASVIKTDLLYFGLAVHGRYYPLTEAWGVPDRVFIDLGLGFNMFNVEGKHDAEDGGFMGVTLSLKAGYKLMFGDRFYFEPSMVFVYAKKPIIIDLPTPFGWQPGMSIGVAF